MTHFVRKHSVAFSRPIVHTYKCTVYTTRNPNDYANQQHVYNFLNQSYKHHILTSSRGTLR